MHHLKAISMPYVAATIEVRQSRYQYVDDSKGAEDGRLVKTN